MFLFTKILLPYYYKILVRAFIFAFWFCLFSFMNAIFTPGKQYKVGLHRLKNNLSNKIRTYASTQMYIQKFGEVVLRHVHWGIYDEKSNLFFPNKNFIVLDPKFKKQLIFPEHWFYTTDGTNEKIIPIKEINTDDEVVPVKQQYSEKYTKNHLENVFVFLKKFIN